MKQLLPEAVYKNARLAFDDKSLRKTLSKASHNKIKLEEKEARKARKRSYKESLLVWDEQIGKQSDQSKDDWITPYSSNKFDKICEYKLEMNKEFKDNADSKSNTSKHSETNLKDINKSSKWGTPLNNKGFKHDLLLFNSRK